MIHARTLVVLGCAVVLGACRKEAPGPEPLELAARDGACSSMG